MNNKIVVREQSQNSMYDEFIPKVPGWDVTSAVKTLSRQYHPNEQLKDSMICNASNGAVTGEIDTKDFPILTPTIYLNAPFCQYEKHIDLETELGKTPAKLLAKYLITPNELILDFYRCIIPSEGIGFLVKKEEDFVESLFKQFAIDKNQNLSGLSLEDYEERDHPFKKESIEHFKNLELMVQSNYSWFL